MMDFSIFILNLIEAIVKVFIVDEYFFDETEWGISIKILKALRFFRILYSANVLKPLNEMIFAFVKTFE